jgi:hypothetical protein
VNAPSRKFASGSAYRSIAPTRLRSIQARISFSTIHPNTMVLRAFDAHGIPLLEQTWCSVGGGFVCREEEVGKESATNLKTPAPFDFTSGEDPLT